MTSEVKTFNDSEFSNNGFDLLRYFAASIVILAHFSWQTVELYHISVPLLSKIVDVILLFNPLIGLFSISGYLIAASLEKSNDLKDFFTKRVLRLYPEYWICAIMTLISLFIVVPELLDKGILLWLGTQIFAIPNTPMSLRSYGTGVVNGPLYSVLLQIQLYVVFALFHKHIKKLKTWQWLVLLAFLLGVNIGTGYLVDHVGPLFTNAIGKLFIPFAIWFFTGAFIYYKRDRLIPLLKKAFFPLLVAHILIKVIGIETPGYFQESLPGLLTTLLYVGGGYILPKVHFKVDLTYGMFLYHWPILNIIIHYNFMNKMHWGWALLILVVATMVMAFLSWKFVGQPSKNLIYNYMIKKEKQAT